MIHVSNLGKTDDYVYDISLDGTVVNALGMNVLSNTDGFNFQMPEESKLRYTEEHPYISNGAGRNSVKGKAYTGVEADVAEFEDMYFNQAWNGGVNKMGLGIDEYCDATINFSRKNYADLMPNGSTKKVGNTIKSRKMSGYIEKFLDIGIDLLLHGNGKGFIKYYYQYIDDIYNYRIPLRDIASKGKIKKSLEDYTYEREYKTTKSGGKMARQAWYELCIKENRVVGIDDTIYYINTGSKKGDGDVKRIVHQFVDYKGEIVELDSKIKKEILTDYCNNTQTDLKTLKEKDKKEILNVYIHHEVDEIVLNCKMVSNDIVDAPEDILCNGDIEYNVAKYIDMFNKRITPLLVCFKKGVRERIMITNPDDIQYFTADECELDSGNPKNETDQDTYEQLMTMDRKEVEFWYEMGIEPPFTKECGMDWDAIKAEYEEIKKQEDNELFKIEDAKYNEALLNFTYEDFEDFTEKGTLPSSITDVVTLCEDMHLRFNKLPNMTPSTGGYIYDDLMRSKDDADINSDEEFEKFIMEYNEG